VEDLPGMSGRINVNADATSDIFAASIELMRRSLIQLALLATGASALAAACGLDLVGSPSSPDAANDGGAPPSNDARADAPGAETEAGAVDGGADAAVGDGGCPAVAPVPDSGARKASVVRSATAKTIDGVLDDWRGCTSLVLDPTTSAKTALTPKASAQVFLEWEEDALYIAVIVSDAKLDGTFPESYKNDSVEIYASGTAPRVGNYGPFDHHYIVDHLGKAEDYSAVNTPVPWVGAVRAAMAGGYRIEARIPASALGAAPLAKGNTLAFDLMLNDEEPKGYLIWAMTPHATCTLCTLDCACNFSPAYDTMTFAPITLE
jgi:hypothetical protein